MTKSGILSAPWPDDLDSSEVPFLGRTRTVLERSGFFDDPSLFDDLTEDSAAAWWNTGTVTISDIRSTGNEAIRRHYDETDLRVRIDADLAAVALEPWAPHIWHRDPRFAEFIPKGEATVFDIATAGSTGVKRSLWERLEDLSAAVTAHGALSLREAVSEYVEAVSGQHGSRLEALLAVTGLNGCDPVTRAEAGRLIGVSQQRMHQIVQQMHRRLDRARPQDGAWLPQVGTAERTQWPGEFTAKGIEATRNTLVRHRTVPNET